MQKMYWKSANWRYGAGLLGFCAWLSTSCHPEDKLAGQKEVVLATAGAQVLYTQAIDMDLLPTSMDSARYVQKRTKDWVLEELMLGYAAQDAAIDVEKIEDKVRNYRKMITMHALEAHYVEEKLDREVKEADIRGYYEEKLDHFVLNEDILRLIYIKMPPSAPEVGDFRAFLRKKASSPADMEDLRAYCKEHADACMLSRATWIPKHRVISALPAKRRRMAQKRLKKQAYLEVRGAAHIHLLRIFDYRAARTVPPLDYLRPNIVQDILNKRRKGLVKSLRAKIWDKAKQENTFAIF